MEAISFILLAYVGFILIYLAIIIGAYVLRALGLYTMAKNQAIDNAWLSWIPIADTYIMGRLSEASPYVKRKVPKMHVILPSVIGGYIVLSIILPLVFQISLIPSILNEFDTMNIPLFAGIWIFFILTAFAIRALQLFVLYHIYKTYDPDNATLFLVINIFVSIDFIFLFALRNKMPRIEEDESLSNLTEI